MKSKREQQKKDEKLKKYAQVSTGRRLAGCASSSEVIPTIFSARFITKLVAVFQSSFCTPFRAL